MEKEENDIKPKNDKKYIIICIISTLILLGSIALAIIGCIGIIELDTNYEKALVNCDDKDYTSYIKHTEKTIPGNDNINSQLEIVKQAMQSASNENDTASFERLWEEYNKLLQLQAQTSTTTEDYDYSEVEVAKNKCYNLAEKQKESTQKKNIVLLSIGLGIFFCSSLILAITLLKWKPIK